MLPERFAWFGLLLDFYAPLLTPRQQEVARLYYEENLSRGEIAEILDISRQAVHDLLKRAEKALAGYEERLQLAAGHLAARERTGPEGR